MLTQSALAIAAASLPSFAAEQERPKTRKIAITIDDGPATVSGRDLDSFVRISKGLRESFVAEKVPAIMFVNERQFNVDGQRDARVAMLQQWLDAGLDLGNHTYSHPNLDRIPVDQFLDDIIKGEVVSRALLEARGKKLIWFRYPFLAAGKDETAKVVEEFLIKRGYKIAPVTVDYADYSYAGTYQGHLRAGNQAKADELFSTVMAMLDQSFARVEKRSVEVLGYELPQVLLIHCNEMNSLTLRTTLQRIRDRGYTFVSIDEAMSDAAFQTGIRPGGMGGGGFFNSLDAAKRSAAQ